MPAGGAGYLTPRPRRKGSVVYIGIGTLLLVIILIILLT
jgi:hypothetical protein